MTVELFSVLRVLGFVIGLLTIVLPWIVRTLAIPRTTLIRRIAFALGLGAQIASSGHDVARGRAPWTKPLDGV